jgi:hypothetical protein
METISALAESRYSKTLPRRDRVGRKTELTVQSEQPRSDRRFKADMKFDHIRYRI